MLVSCRRALWAGLLVAGTIVACTGGTGSAPDGGTDGSADSGTDAASEASNPGATCASIAKEHEGLFANAAYRGCTTKSDCQLLSGAICTYGDQHGVNAAGADAAKKIAASYRSAGCEPPDCGSGGGPTLTADCVGGLCIARYSDGGVKD